MILHELEKLIRSLSPAEKKHFKLSSAKYEGDKDYLLLFDIMVSLPPKKPADMVEIFKKRSKLKTVDNTANYLFKILIDQLVNVRINQDKWFARHYSLMKARLCFERSLTEKGMQELKKTQKLAEQAQDHNLYHESMREELNYMADIGFGKLSEQEIVDIQMKSKRSLKILHQIHEHHSIYELLKHRLLNESNGIRSKKAVNDLILSELSIISGGEKNQFESLKTHLLFQSFFLVHTKQYHSALIVFKDLHTLFEKNEQSWNYPPYDNLSALDEILDNLHHMKYYVEMEYFIQKIEHLKSKDYPEHFKNLAHQTLCIYQLIMLIGERNYKSALQFTKSIHEEILLTSHSIKTEKQLKLLLFIALTYFYNQQYKQANKYVSYALNDHKAMNNSVVYRICRLLHIMIHYELDNIDYLDYEIRAYKRFYQQQGKSFKTEKLVFDMIKANPRNSPIAGKRSAFKKISQQIEEITINQQEDIFSKHVNICEWVSGFFA